MKTGLDGVTLNGVPLANIIEDIPPDPADDYQKTKDKVFCYHRPRIVRSTSGPEKRRGKVKHLQKEINMHNKSEVIREAKEQHGILGAVVACLMTNKEPLDIDQIYLDLEIDRESSDGARVRFYLGRIKRSKLAPYMRFTERSSKGKATYGMTEDGFNLVPVDAIMLAKDSSIDGKKRKKKAGTKKETPASELPGDGYEERCFYKEPPDLDTRGATFNLDLGEIHFHFHININLPR